jgi:hypothetical protein
MGSLRHPAVRGVAVAVCVCVCMCVCVYVCVYVCAYTAERQPPHHWCTYKGKASQREGEGLGWALGRVGGG